MRDPVGSKSPLALVDSFNIVSNKNGKAYHCLWFKEEGAIPTPIITHIVDTTEPNGIAVVVPLDSAKFDKQSIRQTAISAIREQLVCFRQHFRVVNDLSLSDNERLDITDEVFKGMEPVYEDNVVTVFKQNGSGTSTKLSVGNVVYPLPSGCNHVSLSTSGVSHGFLVCVKIPIGKLDIPMSREMVNGSDANKLLVNKYIADCNAHLSTEYKNAVNTFTTASKFLKEVEGIKTKFGFVPTATSVDCVEDLLIKKTFLYQLLTDNYTIRSPNLLFQSYDYSRHGPLRYTHDLKSKMAAKNFKLLLVSMKVSRSIPYKSYMLKHALDNIIVAKYDDSVVTTTEVAALKASFKDVLDDYKTAMQDTFTIVEDADITAWSIANPTVRTKSALAGTVKSDFIGRYYYPFNAYGYLYAYTSCVNVPHSTRSVTKEYDANGKEIPFGPHYFNGYKNILLIAKGDDTNLPIEWDKGLLLSTQTIKDIFKDFLVVHATPSFYAKVLAAFTADPTIKVYTSTSKYVITGTLLDITTVHSQAFKTHVRNTFIKYINYSMSYAIRANTDGVRAFLLRNIRETCEEMSLDINKPFTVLQRAVLEEMAGLLQDITFFDKSYSTSIGMLQDKNNVVEGVMPLVYQQFLLDYVSKGMWKKAFNIFYNCYIVDKAARDRILLQNNITP